MLLVRDCILKFIIIINKMKINKVIVNNKIIPFKLKKGFWFSMIWCYLTNTV